MRITKRQLRKIIRESTLRVTRGPYGITVEDEEENYLSIGVMVADLLAIGEDDIFKAPQGIDPEALKNLMASHEKGTGGGMEQWGPDVFENYYDVDTERVVRLYARLKNHSIKEVPYDEGY